MAKKTAKTTDSDGSAFPLDYESDFLAAELVGPTDRKILDEIRHIRGFLAVVRLASVTRAADELHISQPGLTNQIRHLERLFGIPLLSRNKKQVVLTAAGKKLVVPMQRLVDEFEDVMAVSKDLAQLRRGVITVAAMQSVSATILPQAISKFAKFYPAVFVKVIDSAANLGELVKSGEVDFGIDGSIQRDRSLVVKNLFKEPICLFAPVDHPLSKYKSIALRELARYPIILPQKHTNLYEIIQGALKSARLRVHAAHENTHMSTTIAMVSAGLGIALLPVGVKECFASDKMQCIAISEPKLERQVVTVTKASREYSAPARKLVEILHQIVA